MELKYFIYCRKSSESEDRQMLSLPAQVRELQEYAIKNNLRVITTYQESKSAFKIGRERFDELISRIADGEANAILTWQANRVSRNPMDAGRIIYSMDEKLLNEIRTPQRTYYNTPNDKFMLGLELGIAKKDSDEKSENVKRGNREKFFEKKTWLGVAKQGYLNYCDPITKEKTIAVDKDRFLLLQKAVKLILSGSHTPMEALSELNIKWGYRTRKSKRQGGYPMMKSSFYRFLADPYYYGLMIRSEGQQVGSHQPMLTKEEFDRLQIILGRKGRPHIGKHEFPYKGVLSCGQCGASITAERKTQIICSWCKQKFHKGKLTNQCPECETLIENIKNPKILVYVYYHCTKKKDPLCSQGCITIENLENQIGEELKKVDISPKFKNWAIKYLNELNDLESNNRHTVNKSLQNAYNDCQKKLDNLLQLKISVQNERNLIISDEEYLAQRKLLLKEKERLLTEMNSSNHQANQWLELCEKTFDFCLYARYWLAKGDLRTKPQILATLGSNITLKDKKLFVDQHKSFFLIKKANDEFSKVEEKFEPRKEVYPTLQNLQSDSSSSIVLGGRESNPDKFLQRELSDH